MLLKRRGREARCVAGCPGRCVVSEKCWLLFHRLNFLSYFFFISLDFAGHTHPGRKSVPEHFTAQCVVVMRFEHWLHAILVSDSHILYMWKTIKTLSSPVLMVVAADNRRSFTRMRNLLLVVPDNSNRSWRVLNCSNDPERQKLYVFRSYPQNKNMVFSWLLKIWSNEPGWCSRIA